MEKMAKIEKIDSSEVMFWEIVSRKDNVKRKIGNAKSPRNCSVRKSGRNPLIGADAQKWPNFKNGIVGSGDDGNTFQKMS